MIRLSGGDTAMVLIGPRTAFLSLLGAGGAAHGRWSDSSTSHHWACRHSDDSAHHEGGRPAGSPVGHATCRARRGGWPLLSRRPDAEPRMVGTMGAAHRRKAS
jgi:hypothetical protein